MNSKIFITGGISSGKSGFAEKLATDIYMELAGGAPDLDILGMNMDSGNVGADGNTAAAALARFIATARTSSSDREMLFKIEKHKQKRPGFFVVHEDFDDFIEELTLAGGSFDGDRGILLVDSLTMWLSSVFTEESEYGFARKCISGLSDCISNLNCSVITVADSLAFNLIPDSPYLRMFLELNGIMEQEISALSDKSYLVVAGNPLVLK